MLPALPFVGAGARDGWEALKFMGKRAIDNGRQIYGRGLTPHIQTMGPNLTPSSQMYGGINGMRRAFNPLFGNGMGATYHTLGEAVLANPGASISRTILTNPHYVGGIIPW